jgi:uncharacterized protein YbcI
MAVERGASLTGARLSAAISDAIVHLHKKYYGKGPSEAKTYIGDDYIFCILRDPFTTVEETLVSVGHQRVVRDVRQSFQDAMAQQFKQTVEELSRRKVDALMTQIHSDPDLAIGVFKLGSEVVPKQSESSKTVS